jgi:hypothetical protein
MAQRWQQLEAPTASWAKRYSSEDDFELAMQFLQDSSYGAKQPREKIFLSYRRNDSPHATDRIFDRLVKVFGEDAIFYDVSTIPPGEHFKTQIGAAISRCVVVLVIIGDHWFDADSNGLRRLDHPEDVVRLEIRRAIAAGIEIIPVLVGSSSTMPRRDDLPLDIRSLSEFNAVEMRPGRGFPQAADKLINRMKHLMPRRNLTGLWHSWKPTPTRQTGE